ncbi:hypothetical protein L6R52_26420, partial [Myxococcota bacterium]|nr:hypothetical protein [Myxococcota bacterium]
MPPSTWSDAAERARTLETLASRGAPVRVRICIEGAAAELASEIFVVVQAGRVVSAVAGAATGARALMVSFLADRADIEVEPWPPLGDVEASPRADVLLAEAEARARGVEAALTPLGGLGGVAAAALSSLVERLDELPEAASAVLRLVDGQRTNARVLRESPFDAQLTARILERLASMKILHRRVGPQVRGS